MTASLTLISSIGLIYSLGDQFTSSSMNVGWIALAYVFNAMYFHDGCLHFLYEENEEYWSVNFLWHYLMVYLTQY